MITSLANNGLTKGMTLQEMVKSSMRADNAYARSSTDNAAQRNHIHQRMSIEKWNALGTHLVGCLGNISEKSNNWTNAEPARDFQSAEWTNLEQQGETLFVAEKVQIAQDLVAVSQMSGDRDELVEIAQSTEDHIESLLRVKEKLETYERDLVQWMQKNERHNWYSAESHHGHNWDRDQRTDGWPE